MKRTISVLSCLFLLISAPFALASESHEHEGKDHGHEQAVDLDHLDDHADQGKEHGHDEEGGVVELDAEAIKVGGIVVREVVERPFAQEVMAPGEVRLNAYQTTHVTPRIAGQIIARHVRLGDQVKQGQPLVTLSSIEMAEAQGQLLVAEQEWQRVSKLGRDVVSARRYTEANIARAQARARVRAFGMTEAQVKALQGTPDPALAIGTFDLLSPQNGTVISDDFVLGEIAEPGRLLLTVTDESSVWIAAHLAPVDADLAIPGAVAQVRVESTGGETLSITGKLSQVQHQVDEATRTFPARIVVENPHHILHPGMFVQVAIQGHEQQTALLIPESAVQRQGTERVVFVEEGEGRYERREVEVGSAWNGEIPILSGLEAGEHVVTEGAFSLLSELAKAGFEVHNH